MNSRDFGYFLKNISLPSKYSYKYKLIKKTEELLKQMRWKAFFYDRENTNKYNNKINTYLDETIDKKLKKQESVLRKYKL